MVNLLANPPGRTNYLFSPPSSFLPFASSIICILFFSASPHHCTLTEQCIAWSNAVCFGSEVIPIRYSPCWNAVSPSQPESVKSTLPMLLFNPSSYRHGVSRISSSVFLCSWPLDSLIPLPQTHKSQMQSKPWNIKFNELSNWKETEERIGEKGISSGENLRNESIACDMQRQGVKRRWEE